MGHTLAHETTHLWAAEIGDRETEEGDMPLQSPQGGHWSYGLNIGYDPVGGARWQDNKDETFTMLGPEEWCAKPREGSGSFPPRLGFPRMSDLTLYLAGAIKKEEVQPMVWINTLEPGVRSTRTLDIGETVVRPTQTSTITIEDVVKRYGRVECFKRSERGRY